MKRLGTYYGSRNAASSMRAGGRPARQNCAMDTSPGIPPAGKSNPPITIGLPRPPGLAWAASLLDAATGLHALEQYYRVRPEALTPPRSEERRVGKEGVSTCRSRGSPCH